MTRKILNRVTVILLALIIFGGTFLFVLIPDKDHSSAERRPLKQFPELTTESVFSGRFMSNFESYTQDQFPGREFFRSIKAFVSLNIFQRQDNNGVYSADGHLSTIDYPLNKDSLSWAAGRIENVQKLYLNDSGCNVFFSIIPDKNCFLAEKNGYPAYDYEELVSFMKDSTDGMEYVDIFPLLSLDSYYLTDSHWKQEEIVPVAEKLLESMGAGKMDAHTVNTAEGDFRGVYAGQFALPTKAEKNRYLTNEVTDNFKVFDGENGKEIPLYDMEAALGEDPYEIFVGGPLSLVTIDNPTAENDRELIVFRDSFGSSIAPLLAEGYSKVTLVDIRYIRSDFLKDHISFENQDVLFLYSTSVLNNSEMLK